LFSTEFYALISEILVGSSTVTAIGLIVWLCQQPDERFLDFLRRQAQQLLGSTPEAGGRLIEAVLFPVAAALILGLGLAVEDAVDDSIDSHPVTMKWIAVTVQFFVGSKEAHRFGALYEPIYHSLKERSLLSIGHYAECESKEPYSYKLTALGNELLGIPKELFAAFIPPLAQMTAEDKLRWTRFLQRPDRFLFEYPFADDPRHSSIITPENRNLAELWMCDPTRPDCELQRKDERWARCRLVTGVAQGLYYDGNNWAKKSEPTVNVLRRWEITVDTVGSLAALATLIMAATFLYAPVEWWWRKRRGDKWKSVVRWFVGSVLVMVFCSYSYVVGLRGYTGRAMGMPPLTAARMSAWPKWPVGN